MSKRTVGIVLIVLGLLLVVVSLAADLIGMGAQNGIGWKQLLGAAVGVVVMVGGVWWMRRKS